MDAGKLNTRIKILDYRLIDDVWQWVEAGGAWAMPEYKERVIYSPYAIARPGVKLTIRRQPFTPAFALDMAGKHYVVATVEDLPTERYLVVTAAAMTPMLCVGEQPTITYDDLRRPVYGLPQITRFYGVLSERFVNWMQDKPNAEITQTQILTVPKAIALVSGQTVTVGTDVYAVTRCYLTDEYRNDYEVVRKEDA